MTDRRHRVAAIVVTVADLLLVPVSLALAALSVMLFDAPGSENDTRLWVVFWTTWALPLAFLIGAGFGVAAAIRYTRRRLLLAIGVPGVVVAWLALALATLV